MNNSQVKLPVHLVRKGQAPRASRKSFIIHLCPFHGNRFGQRWTRFEREGFEIIVLGFNIGAWTLAARRIGMSGEIRVLKSYGWGPE
jgi:hypothetical protein